MTLKAYLGLPARFYGFYVVIEPAAAVLTAAGVDFDFAPRRKTQLLRKNLFALGLSDLN